MKEDRRQGSTRSGSSATASSTPATSGVVPARPGRNLPSRRNGTSGPRQSTQPAPRARIRSSTISSRAARSKSGRRPQGHPFLHGKAGVIETADGGKTSFLGSINETRSAFAKNYEILWEDDSPDGVSWVEEEFAALWKDGLPLPDAILEEVERIANRVEVRFEEVDVADLPAAALAEAPIYRGGQALQPWQRAFVAIFMEHRERYGSARLLLADEVGVGKTLSLAASAMLSPLNDGPVLILCPSTLTLQWQVELKDKLGIPSAVWTNKKAWLDHRGHEIRTRSTSDVARCPFQIGIVSTGLIFYQAPECQALLDRKGGFGTLILDEAHRARRNGGMGQNAGEPNNLLSFMQQAAKVSKNVILGTATPIQTATEELWNLLDILGQSRIRARAWLAMATALAGPPMITGKQQVQDEENVCGSCPQPSAAAKRCRPV